MYINVLNYCRMVNYDEMRKHKNLTKVHWDNLSPTSIDNHLLGTTWIYFYNDFIGLRRGMFECALEVM